MTQGAATTLRRSVRAAGSRDVVARLTGVAVKFTNRTESGVIATPVLDNVSLEVYAGELLVVVGRSGCGKTTVLNVFAGLIQPSGGDVTVCGTKPVQARKDMAYMFARDALLPWRTARGNVEYGLELRGKGRRERHELSNRLLGQLGLGKAGGLFPSQLSQGMRQRVALARTWALDPEVLLMDEPFAALDAQTRVEVQNEFLSLWGQRRSAVVFVTHDLAEAILLADRILVMDDGKVIKEFTVDEKRPRDPVDIEGKPWYHELRRELRDLIGTKSAAAPNAS